MHLATFASFLEESSSLYTSRQEKEELEIRFDGEEDYEYLFEEEVIDEE